jgi:hypothetical protein
MGRELCQSASCCINNPTIIISGPNNLGENQGYECFLERYWPCKSS